ncbi:Dihydropteridine reductase [Caligus rogercresseyi]|uniref:Dihydropteridine reductase n=1 Tax=Caligus rogercresseyi TaxID=217165 RepID=A0A7T8KCP0_CALRO|nr:Dihydropteridine reductase [Caligus rogercresseyi]
MSGKVMVYGGMGGLGSAIVSHFKAKDFWVLSLDTKANEKADSNVLVDIRTFLMRQSK